MEVIYHQHQAQATLPQEIDTGTLSVCWLGGDQTVLDAFERSNFSCSYRFEVGTHRSITCKHSNVGGRETFDTNPMLQCHTPSTV